MRGYLPAIFATVGGLVTVSQAQSVQTVLETNFTTPKGVRGLNHMFSWAEVKYRANSKDSAIVSFIELPAFRLIDEFAYTREQGNASVRLGRFRTSFGFNDWSELVYNGFVMRPLSRVCPLVDQTILNRDDTGVEFATWGSGYQIQLGILDTKSSRFQIGPERARHGSLRLQTDSGSFIIGANLLEGLSSNSRIYGLDLKASAPYLLFRGEAMAGDEGKNPQRGYYGEFEFRLPKTTRTQLVWRTEGMGVRTDWIRLETVGLRQVFQKTTTLNLNYGWCPNGAKNTVTARSRSGWMLGVLYRIAI